MTYHDIALIMAGTSLFTLAMVLLLMLLTVPQHHYSKRLRVCKLYLSILMLVVSASCAKSVIFGISEEMRYSQVSTLITAMLQAWLFTIIGVTIVNPKGVTRKWMAANVLTIIVGAVIALAGLLVVPQYYTVCIVATLAVVLALYAMYVTKFFKEYSSGMKKIDEASDEHIEHRFRWVKAVYLTATVLGVTALVSPFTNPAIHSTWLLFAACVYIYVTVGFIRYGMSNLAAVVKKVDEQYPGDKPKEEEADAQGAADSEPEAEYAQGDASGLDQNADFERKLQEWINQRGCMQEGVVSADLARQLGVSLSFFRSYFKTHMNTDFRQWRQQKRIERACQIIEDNPEYSYDMIAEMVGIGDRSNFNKAFVKIMGMTPKEYGRKCEIK